VIVCGDSGALPFAGCGEKRGSQPVGFLLAGSADCPCHVLRFVGTQPHGKHRCQAVLLRQSGASHLFRHRKRKFVYKKFLTTIYFSFTRSLVLKFKTALSSEKMAGTAAGESELTNSLPVEAGASRGESEMNAQTFQVGNSDRQSRFLKVEATGDFFYRKITPKIRLAGKWLAQAGFKPGHRVQILIEQPGCLTLRFVEQGKKASL
jgi:Toxin SymE, type I toxin-antitoxin system